jgi:hypothetical protein
VAGATGVQGIQGNTGVQGTTGIASVDIPVLTQYDWCTIDSDYPSAHHYQNLGLRNDGTEIRTLVRALLPTYSYKVGVVRGHVTFTGDITGTVRFGFGGKAWSSTYASWFNAYEYGPTLPWQVYGAKGALDIDTTDSSAINSTTIPMSSAALAKFTGYLNGNRLDFFTGGLILSVDASATTTTGAITSVPTIVLEIIPAIQGPTGLQGATGLSYLSRNVDGGEAASLYLPSQVVNGGSA